MLFEMMAISLVTSGSRRCMTFSFASTPRWAQPKMSVFLMTLKPCHDWVPCATWSSPQQETQYLQIFATEAHVNGMRIWIIITQIQLRRPTYNTLSRLVDTFFCSLLPLLILVLRCHHDPSQNFLLRMLLTWPRALILLVLILHLLGLDHFLAHPAGSATALLSSVAL